MTDSLDQTQLDVLLNASQNQPLTAEQLAAQQEATRLKLEQQASQQAHTPLVAPDGTVLSTTPVEEPAPTLPVEVTPEELGVLAARDATGPNHIAERVINRVSTTGDAQPIELAVALRNSLNAMDGWLMMLPDGQAKHGIRAEIVNMREMLD